MWLAASPPKGRPEIGLAFPIGHGRRLSPKGLLMNAFQTEGIAHPQVVNIELENSYHKIEKGQNFHHWVFQYRFRAPPPTIHSTPDKSNGSGPPFSLSSLKILS